MLRVLSAAQDISRRSGGAFDVTVGPLTRLWRRARRQQRLPAASLLAEARQSVGYQLLEVDPQQGAVSLHRPHMQLDLGAIGKGYAVDEALRVLREGGLPRSLVNGGGNLALGDPPPQRTGWSVGIAPLDQANKQLLEIEVANCGVATSGDTWQFVEIDGVRYSHILDPRTGLGLTRRGSVTVLATDGMTADGYSTALSVLDVESAVALIEQIPGAAAVIVWLEDGVTKRRASRGFPATVPSSTRKQDSSEASPPTN
jgi:thiamine biosynthesis lipoprotein